MGRVKLGSRVTVLLSLSLAVTVVGCVSNEWTGGDGDVTSSAGDADLSEGDADLVLPPGDGDPGDGGDDSGEPVDFEGVCDGYDDDGDGRVDEGCSCLPGTSQPCYPGAPDEVDVGICRAGTQGCEGAGEFGGWGDCVGAVLPEEELCGDRIDNDCTGVADDSPLCICDEGETRPCYSGPPGTEGVGICRGGYQECSPVPGVGWIETCFDEVLPREEMCGNGIDDDCNGAVDDGAECACLEGETRDCYSGPREEIGVGVCRAGTQSCLPGGTRFTDCAGEVGPSPEECDGLDNDCDGEADEGCPTIVNLDLNLDGDCLTVSCPGHAPYPVACNITMHGDDHRGCVASTPTSPVVYFQEGDRCGAGRVTGRLSCSSEVGEGLHEGNCTINKPTRYYPRDRHGCPDTD